MHQALPLKWRHFTAEMILYAVRWYLRYALKLPGHGGAYAEVLRGRRPQYSVSVDPTLCDGNGETLPAAVERDKQLIPRR